MGWSSRNAWALGQPGMERRLEAELARLLGGAVFERPGGGLVTFSSSRELALDWSPELVFARATGLVAPERGPDAPPVILQVWKRRDGLPGARLDPGFERGRLRLEAESRADLAARGWRMRPSSEVPAIGDPVVSVLWAAKDRVVNGLHLHDAGRLPYPGGEYPWPEQEVPSRAYVKAREVLEWTGAPLMAGDRVLELGCAPGGATLALLERGARVLGVDPAPMSARFEEARASAGGEFRQRVARAEDLAAADLPERVDWLVSDMNVDAEELLSWVRKLWPELRERGTRGALLTLKAARDEFWDSVGVLSMRLAEELGASRIVLKQLSQHRRELLCSISA